VSKINYQYDLQNLTPANASPVEANFTRTEDHINQELIERDGSVAMRAQLKLVGDPVAALDAAPKQYVDQVLPIGIVMMWGADVPPANGKWLLCDGSPQQTAAYPELFAIIGYKWGGSGGSFNTPSMGGRFPLGVNASHPISQQGGSEASSLPAHNHDIAHTHGAATTNATDTNHYHGAVGHSHGISMTTDTQGTHSHGDISGQSFIISWGLGGEPLSTNWSGASPFPLNTSARTANDGAHAHNVNGNTQNADVGTTWIDAASPNASHAHGFQPPTFNGVSGQAGVAPAGTNMPPFLAIPYIIRAK